MVTAMIPPSVLPQEVVPAVPRSLRRSTPEEDLDRADLAAVAAGRLDALAGIVARHGRLAYSIALRITPDQTAAEDAVQEAFLGIWRNAGRYTPERGSVKTWLVAIVHHRAVDTIRRQRRRPTSEWPEAEFFHPPLLIAPDPWREVSAQLDVRSVRAALAVLPPAQRHALELAYFEGLTQREIAVRTNAPLGTVKSRMRLGLRSLRSHFESSEWDASPRG